ALAIALDAVVVIGLLAVFSHHPGEPYRALYLVPIAEAALRFGLFGGVISGLVMVGATVIIDLLGPGGAWRGAAIRLAVGRSAGGRARRGRPCPRDRHRRARRRRRGPAGYRLAARRLGHRRRARWPDGRAARPGAGAEARRRGACRARPAQPARRAAAGRSEGD